MADFSEGEIVTYFPIKLNVDDNRHWPAKILHIGRRIQVEIDAPGGGKEEMGYAKAHREAG